MQDEHLRSSYRPPTAAPEGAPESHTGSTLQPWHPPHLTRIQLSGNTEYAPYIATDAAPSAPSSIS